MNWIKYLALIVETVVAFLLIAIILLQRSKEQGLGLAFGSGMGESLFGSRAGNVLTRITVVLAIIFFLNTIVLARIFSGASGQRSIMEEVGSTPTEQPGQPPAQPTGTPVAPPAEATTPPDAGVGGVEVPVDLGAGADVAPAAAPVEPAPPPAE